MEPWVWILLLTLAGLSLLLAEVYLPGAVAGTMGACALVTAWVLCWVTLGTVAGLIYFIAIGLIGLIAFALWLKYFHRTFAGKRMVNTETLAGAVSAQPAMCRVGDPGRAVTPLRPSGVARIGEHRIDVIAEGTMIEAGAGIVVLAVEGSRVTVAEAPKVLAAAESSA